MAHLPTIRHAGLGLCSVALVAPVAAVLVPAGAAVPGANGLIAYTSAGEPDGTNLDVYVVDPDGLTTRLTTDAAVDTQPAVSPNGKEVAFVSERVDPGDGSVDSELYVMDAVDDDGDGEGDDLRQVTRNVGVEDVAPAWSPDGRKVAFTRDTGTGADIYVVDPDVADPAQAELVRLTSSAAEDANPAWSPDGSRLAFQSRRDGNLELYLMDTADADQDGEGDDLARVTTSAGIDQMPDFSPDGEWLTFSSARPSSPTDTNPDLNVWVARLDGSEARVLNPNMDQNNDRWPHWSPAGDYVVYWSGRGNAMGNGSEIFKVVSGGGPAIHVTDDLNFDSYPHWGPAPVKQRP